MTEAQTLWHTLRPLIVRCRTSPVAINTLNEVIPMLDEKYGTGEKTELEEMLERFDETFAKQEKKIFSLGDIAEIMETEKTKNK